MATIIHIADVHFGPSAYGQFYYAALDEFFKDLTAKLKKRPVDQVIIAGDIFKSANANRKDAVKAFNTIGDLAKHSPVSVIIGNHDLPNDSIKDHMLSPLKYYNNVHIPTDDMYLDVSVNRYTLRLFNYIPKSMMDYDVIGPLIQDCDIAVLHGTLEQAKISNTYSLSKQAVAYTTGFFKKYHPRLKTIFMGDIHLPQQIKIDDITVSYCGSPVPVDFGEEHKHGFYIHNIEDDQVTSTFYEVNHLNVYTIDIPEVCKEQSDLVTEIKDAIQNIDLWKSSRNIVKVRYTPTQYLSTAINLDEVRSEFPEIQFLHIEASAPVIDVNSKESHNYEGTPRSTISDVKNYFTTQNKDPLPYLKRHEELTNA